MSQIVIKGAKVHNLKNIDITIPRNKIVCFVGVSGSGKSTIAFDIIAREGQRQYFESLSSFARRYLNKSNRPNVESIKGISSSIIIGQDKLGHNPRSTVGTVTEAYTYLRLLYSRAGWPAMDSSYYSFNHPNGFCQNCKGLGRAMEININSLVDFNKTLNEGAIKYSNWRVGSMAWKIIKATQFFNMNKKIINFSEKELSLLLYAPKQVVKNKGIDQVINWTYKGIVTHLKGRGNSATRTISEIEKSYFSYTDCQVCNGSRLNKAALDVKINGLNIGEVSRMPLIDCQSFIKSIDHPHANVIKPRLIKQLQYLINAGVDYLSLSRATNTLSGGEAQRVKMARQLGSDLVETIYVLDEPTTGLHPKDMERVISNLISLRNNGNTVLVVEHDPKVIAAVDHIIEIGPGGGKKGGKIIAEGNLNAIINNNSSITANYLINEKEKRQYNKKRKIKDYLFIKNTKLHNLKNFNIRIPKHVLVTLTGVSGSGKSSLIEEIKTQHSKEVVLIDQSSLGANCRGCIATYVGAFDIIRQLFAKNNNQSVSLFSYNSKGACPDCQGLGYVNLDMNFLGNINVKCGRCNGKKYNRQALTYLYKGKNISEVLNLTIDEAAIFFKHSVLASHFDLLTKVGLDYINLGQSLNTLSGGESQRLKLVKKLQSKGEFYILDEPTSGLHFKDIAMLLKLLNILIKQGNSVLVVEHNLDIIKNADWVIDLGPEGGEQGGEVVAQGTPEEVANISNSYTGQYLRNVI